ncbi:MAG: hypothetical protein H0W12_10075 [Chitinophagaceae bacterium]|nr:hypothetical protein [Chitinophagaceae bacterium]
MTKLNFIPAKHGFHFDNEFKNNIVGNINAGEGLCGGMSLAAYNYFISNIPVPTHNALDNDFGGSDPVPPLHSKIRDYILAMQWETFPFCGPYLVFPGFNTPRQHFNWCVSEFDVIKKIIDEGNFPLLGLRGSNRLGGTMGDHQVLVYGYDVNPSRLFIYDCNSPDNETVLELDMSNMQLLHNGNNNTFISFFKMLELNPTILSGLNTPTYIDLGIQSGLTVSTNGIVGAPTSFSVTIKNFGDFNAHVNSFLISLRDPSGANIDYMTGGMQAHPLQIAPTEEVIISGQCPNLGTVPGNYTAGLSYLSKQNQLINIPAKVVGTVSQVVFYLRPAPGRIGVLDNNGNVYVKEGALDAGWSLESSGVNSFALAGNRIGVLDNNGNVYVKEGALDAEWVWESSEVHSFALAGNRIGVLDNNGNLNVKEGALDGAWVLESWNVQSFALAGNRIGVLDNNGNVNVKEGALDAGWVWESSGIRSIALTVINTI